jgi:PAS domain S-box-containing protein
MLEPQSIQITTAGLFNRRWVAPIYAAFAVALLVLATLPQADRVTQFAPALALLIVLLIAAPLTGLLLVQQRDPRWKTLTLPLLLIDAGAALGLVALTGGYSSPMWVALLVVSTAAPLLLSGRRAALLLSFVWLVDGLLVLQAPHPELLGALASWAMRAAGVAVIALAVQRTLAAEQVLRRRAERREQALHDVLAFSNRLRVTSQPGAILNEVAQAVQASGAFSCVTLSRVDWRSAVVTVEVAHGAGARRLTAVEGLQLDWKEFAPLLNERLRVSHGAYVVDALPFRTVKREQHALLTLTSQFGEPRGLLTVSFPVSSRAALSEALPLLELLANQAAAALDNSALYTTLEQRVEEATAAYARGQVELAHARDRAETLYRIVRTLSGSLDEREVLAQALELVSLATGAERSGIMLVDPTSGQLMFRTTLDRAAGGPASGLERGLELAGLVLAGRRPALIADTRKDASWQTRGPDSQNRSVLAVPLMLEDEPLGVLLLAHAQPESFRYEHQQLALAAASQVAVALSKAQLYRYVTEQSERLGMTLKQREEEISKIQAILRSIGDGVVMGDRLGRVRLVNPAAAEMLGVDAATLVGRQITDLAGVPAAVERETPNADRQVSIGDRTLRAAYASVETSSGEWLGGVVVYHDITREALADRLKSEFIATASHELRTPLTSIRGYIDLLLLGTLGQLTPAQADFLKVVKNNIARIVELIDDLLDISKVEAGEIRLRREPVDVAEVLHEVGQALYSQFTERSISLAIDVQPDLPPIMADRLRLRQIVVNLVSNACKYTPPGGHVDVVLRNGGDQLRVDVHDNGVGIDAAAQQFIFTPFFRADNPLRETAGGTGLGLSITRSLIALHGGRIWFDSHAGEGSTFSFTLPTGDDEWKPAEWLETISPSQV